MSKKPATEIKSIRQKNPVAEQNIWVDAINRENLNLKIYDNFLVNPKKLTVISDKPTQNFLINLNTEKEPVIQTADETKFDTTVKEQLKSLSYIPQQRYVEPITSNHEIGWYAELLQDKKQAEKKFAYERKMCKETKYADVYFTAQKVSPYSNKFK